MKTYILQSGLHPNQQNCFAYGIKLILMARRKRNVKKLYQYQAYVV